FRRRHPVRSPWNSQPSAEASRPRSGGWANSRSCTQRPSNAERHEDSVATCYGEAATCLTPQPAHIALVITVILITAAFLRRALNALAGGGTLVTFPALLFAGLNPIDANASSVVALFIGTFAGAWAYRRNILAVGEVSVLGLFVLSLVGGLVGALLLLWTPT